MRIIEKFPIPLEETFDVLMPLGAEIIRVGSQEDSPAIWAITNPDADPERRTFRMVGTGKRIPDSPTKEYQLVYVGMWHQIGYVWHLFEERKL